MEKQEVIKRAKELEKKLDQIPPSSKDAFKRFEALLPEYYSICKDWNIALNDPNACVTNFINSWKQDFQIQLYSNLSRIIGRT